MRIASLLGQHIEVPSPPAPLDAKAFPAHGGVYALTDADDKFIQLAAAENLRRALVNRLQPPDADGKRPRADLRAITRHVRFVPTYSQFETMVQFHRCARALMPETYREQIAFGPARFVHVDPEDELPRFTDTSRPLDKAGQVVGPFATRTAAAGFIELLEDLFDLCRYFDILQQRPHGQACAYFEMGKCPAPCDGSIPVSQYRRMVSEAADFAAGDRRPFRKTLLERMHNAAGRLAFEQAAALKQTLQRADRIEAAAFRLVRPLDQFNFLIIQRAGGRSRVKPFFVHQGQITIGQQTSAKKLDEVVGEWIRRAGKAAPVDSSADPDYRTEQLWLVSHFLFKQDRVPGLYLRVDELGEPEKLADLIRETFKLSGGRSEESEKGRDRTVDSDSVEPKMPFAPDDGGSERR